MTKEERRDFLHFLQSPLLGNSRQGARLLEIIGRKVLETNLDFLTLELFKEEFFPDSEPDGKSDSQWMEKYVWIRVTNLLDKLMEFFAFQEFRGDDPVQGKYLFRAIRKRGWDKYVPSTYKKASRSGKAPIGARSVYNRMKFFLIVVFTLCLLQIWAQESAPTQEVQLKYSIATNYFEETVEHLYFRQNDEEEFISNY